MTYNVFSGTLNPTQSVVETLWSLYVIFICVRYTVYIIQSVVGWRKNQPLSPVSPKACCSTLARTIRLMAIYPGRPGISRYHRLSLYGSYI